ncbi:MAG: NINE protein [Clostridium sp.]|nr:NINE protein [Clostridium sp.]
MYFCRSCGAQYVTEEAVMCVKCGVPKGQGEEYCHHCGQPVSNQAVVCLNCGVLNQPPFPIGGKSKTAAGILGILLGCFGVHNFYLGYTARAVVQLCLTMAGIPLSCLGIGALMIFGAYVWGLVEGILILAGKISTDGRGAPLGN